MWDADSIGKFLKRFDQFVAAFFGWRFDVTISWGLGFWRVTDRPFGRIFGPVADVFMFVWDGWNHVIRTARPKGRPPKGPGPIYWIPTLFVALMLWEVFT
jgi:hypothetical protein